MIRSSAHSLDHIEPPRSRRCNIIESAKFVLLHVSVPFGCESHSFVQRVSVAPTSYNCAIAAWAKSINELPVVQSVYGATKDELDQL